MPEFEENKGFKMKGWSGWSPLKTHTEGHGVDFDLDNIKDWDGTNTVVNPVKITKNQKKYDKLVIRAITEKDPKKQKKKLNKAAKLQTSMVKRAHKKSKKDTKKIIPKYKIELGHRTSSQKWPLRITKK